MTRYWNLNAQIIYMGMKRLQRSFSRIEDEDLIILVEWVEVEKKFPTAEIMDAWSKEIPTVREMLHEHTSHGIACLNSVFSRWRKAATSDARFEESLDEHGFTKDSFQKCREEAKRKADEKAEKAAAEKKRKADEKEKLQAQKILGPRKPTKEMNKLKADLEAAQAAHRELVESRANQDEQVAKYKADYELIAEQNKVLQKKVNLMKAEGTSLTSNLNSAISSLGLLQGIAAQTNNNIVVPNLPEMRAAASRGDQLFVWGIGNESNVVNDFEEMLGGVPGPGPSGSPTHSHHSGGARGSRSSPQDKSPQAFGSRGGAGPSNV